VAEAATAGAEEGPPAGDVVTQQEEAATMVEEEPAVLEAAGTEDVSGAAGSASPVDGEEN
jgi:hypothetical protein